MAMRESTLRDKTQEDAHKQVRATEFSHGLRDSVSKWITLNASKQALITIMHVQLAETNKSCEIIFSVLPQSESKKATQFLTRHAGDIGKFLRKEFPRRMIPFLKFTSV